MAGDCNNCILEKRVCELETTVREHTNQLREVERTAAVSAEQIAVIFKILNEIKAGVEKLDGKMEELKNRQHPDIARIEDSIKEVKKDVESLKAKPGKNWDHVATALITAVVLAAIMKFIG